MEDFIKTNKDKYRDFDKMLGHRSHGFMISISKLKEIIRKLFGKNKSKKHDDRYIWVCEFGHVVTDGSQNEVPYCKICGTRLKMVNIGGLEK